MDTAYHPQPKQDKIACAVHGGVSWHELRDSCETSDSHCNSATHHKSR